MLPSGRLFMKSSRSVIASVCRSYSEREMQPARRSSKLMPAVWRCGFGGAAGLTVRLLSRLLAPGNPGRRPQAAHPRTSSPVVAALSHTA